MVVHLLLLVYMCHFPNLTLLYFRQRSFYNSAYMFGDGLEADIFSLQIGAMLLSPDAFVAILLDAFGITDWFSLVSANEPAASSSNEVGQELV